MLNKFKTDIQLIKPPKKLNYPFYYQADKLSLLASSELQDYLLSNIWEHNFGLDENKQGLSIGKMFGVLVVKNSNEELFYLAAYSGKLQGSNKPNNIFVPSPNSEDYDFRDEKLKVQEISRELNNLDNEISSYDNLSATCEKEISDFKIRMIEAKRIRKSKRESKSEKEEILIKESLHFKHLLKTLKLNCEQKLQPLKELKEKKKKLIELRKSILQDVQKSQFEQYTFLNAQLVKKSLYTIFKGLPYSPPPGSGDCAAPKLFNYAYQNNLTPISLAEFWWGESPKGEVRRHKNFYPSCSSRCGPILGHMLEGLNVEENPMLINSGLNKNVITIFEDDSILIINKPDGLLSVPGKNIGDSVASRFNNALIIHRLDQETSGLMILAKDSQSQVSLQKQFIEKSIKKKYIAILEGSQLPESGNIDLPLTLDFNNRPRQKVCYNTGKPSLTKFEVLKSKVNTSLVAFYPETGRTHQLRIHSAHHKGLNSPIKGDTLYGIKNERLYLHAQEISFKHPKTNEVLFFECKSDFDLLF
jgi:tRNA pseudouridine32 synthase/23S rRNA pseudouridine746 synthase